jgi:hypothetical protein
LTRLDPSNVNTFAPNRLDAYLISGVRLHPATVSASTELEQWYGLEYRVHTPPSNEGWPR